MFIILIIRKIILWFFVVLSPIFPVLILFSPLRNAAKIWAGEFFRWLLYGPLFAVLLAGLVALWKIGIPLKFSADALSTYPTAINILLGGPGQAVSRENSINTPDTFILYLVALLMLWMVIIIPFILLKIFLDYFNNFQVSESNLIKYMVNAGSPLINKYRGGSPPHPEVPPSGKGGGAGLEQSIPFFQHSATEFGKNLQEAASAGTQAGISAGVSNVFNQGSFQTPSLQAQSINTELLNLTNLTMPTMRDVSRYETALMSQSREGRETVNKIYESLNRISGVSPITTPAEKTHFSSVRETLVRESQKGNALAQGILSASMPASGAEFPSSNRVQSINLDDYEDVKRTWEENYRKLEPPPGTDGKPKERKNWLMEEIKQIPETIDLLLSGNPEKVKQGKERVSKILPFLLLGGFSKAEIVTYLKAKMEAAKAVLNEMLKVEKDEDSKVEVENKPTEQPKTMQAEAKKNPS